MTLLDCILLYQKHMMCYSAIKMMSSYTLTRPHSYYGFTCFYRCCSYIIHPTIVLHDCTGLYFTLLHSTTPQLHSTWLYTSLYHTLYTMNLLLDSTSLYHSSTWFYILSSTSTYNWFTWYCLTLRTSLYLLPLHNLATITFTNYILWE